jgi:hypothetical protein
MFPNIQSKFPVLELKKSLQKLYIAKNFMFCHLTYEIINWFTLQSVIDVRNAKKYAY